MTVHLEIDHLVVSAAILSDGVDYVENALGVKMSPGGKHDNWGTHNALLGLGEIYLEVIAIDPDAPDPDHPRWFDLDNFSGAPRLTNWVVRTHDINAASGQAPDGMGKIMRLSRGDLSWSMVAADQGKLPFDGAFPGLIQWDGSDHPAKRLPDVGCRLSGFSVTHPKADALQAALAGFDGRVADPIGLGKQKSMQALITTPDGLKSLA